MISCLSTETPQFLVSKWNGRFQDFSFFLMISTVICAVQLSGFEWGQHPYALWLRLLHHCSCLFPFNCEFIGECRIQSSSNFCRRWVVEKLLSRIIKSRQQPSLLLETGQQNINNSIMEVNHGLTSLRVKRQVKIYLTPEQMFFA